MKLIICGGRDYWLTVDDFARLDALHAANGFTQVATGLQLGADACGKVWAILHDLPTEDFPANWKLLGPSAGPIRNEAMAKWASPEGACVAFKGNRGTADMLRAAERYHLTIFDLR